MKVFNRVTNRGKGEAYAIRSHRVVTAKPDQAARVAALKAARADRVRAAFSKAGSISSLFK